MAYGFSYRVYFYVFRFRTIQNFKKQIPRLKVVEFVYSFVSLFSYVD